MGDDPRQLVALAESPCLLRSLSYPSLVMLRVLLDASTLESSAVYLDLRELPPGDARISGVGLRGGWLLRRRRRCRSVVAIVGP